MANALEIRNLTVKIKNKIILDNVSLVVRRGQITGMIGGSGSGKTTFIRTILNIQLPENAKIEGSIFFNGEKRSTRNGILVQPVFQDPGSFFNPKWNLQECLEEPLNLIGDFSKKQKAEKIKSLLFDFSMSENYLSQSIRRFSGGELQRISLMRAILCNPTVLLMDEPVSGLDPLIQKDVIQLIRELNVTKKISIFLISHDIDFISGLCDFIYVINKGKILEGNYVSELIQNPANEYTKLLLKSRDLSEIKHK